MIEFVDECRREWRRLGVADPIANEMAADLTADLEEAEAEGGSAEDVLGSSLFDPPRFAADWADARGVTGTTKPVDPAAPPLRGRHGWYRPAAVVAVSTVGFLMALTAGAAVVARHSSAVAAPVRAILTVPGSTRLVGPFPFGLPGRYAVGAPFAVRGPGPVGMLVVALVFAGVVGLGVGVLSWWHWTRRGAGRRLS